ncbi:unnamed protein product [Colias eurytheme]|nr:unnamed protein product [Colias eurytheme]
MTNRSDTDDGDNYNYPQKRYENQAALNLNIVADKIVKPKRSQNKPSTINLNDVAEIVGHLPGTRSGRPREMHDPDTVESVLEEVARDPSVSVRTLEHRIGIPKSQAHRILQQEGFHPYHIQRVQQLKPEDYPRRVAFCQEMLRRQAENEIFFHCVAPTIPRLKPN